MSETVEYLIAQHIPDLFRREPRNLGVIVRREGETELRFFGEAASGVIDGRSLRAFEAPDVYRQWVTYWREASQREPPSRLVDASSAHYRVVHGGEVSDVPRGDSLRDVANYLYALLVSEGGLVEALGGVTDGESPVLTLRNEITQALEGLNILASVDDELPLVRYPVRRGVEIRGSATEPHRPSFFQENGRPSIIEMVDFTVKGKERAKDHAGLTSYMFRDLRDALKEPDAISLVRFAPSDEDSADVRYGLSLLRNESRLVNWADNAQRQAFLVERREAAMGVH